MLNIRAHDARVEKPATLKAVQVFLLVWNRQKRDWISTQSGARYVAESDRWIATRPAQLDSTQEYFVLGWCQDGDELPGITYETPPPDEAPELPVLRWS